MNNIPVELKELNRWICTDDSKVPMRAWEYQAASSTNADTWSNYDRAIQSVKDGYYPYCGFVFAEDGYVGIDIDDGFDEYGLPTELAIDIINHCKSYTEKSMSGRGFHIIVKGDLPFKGRNNLKGVEIYKSARYFIMTGDVFVYDTIIENQQAIDYVVDKYFPKTEKKSKNFNEIKIYKPVWENIKNGQRIKIRPTYPKVSKGNRNLSMTSLAGSMHTIGYPKKHIYKELQFANKVACDPPLTDNELMTICNSITSYNRGR